MKATFTEWMNIELEQEYKKVSGFDVGKIHDTGCTYYNDDYVKWLESKITKETNFKVVDNKKLNMKIEVYAIDQNGG